MDRLKMPEGEAIEAGIVTRSIESAQRKVEARNFDIRKQLLEYDDVANDQRKVIYQQRNEILEAASLDEQIANLRKSAMTDVVRTYVPAESVEEQWDLAGPGEGAARRVAARRAAARRWSTPATDHRRRHRRARSWPRPTRPSTPRWRWSASEQFTPFMRMVLLQASTPLARAPGGAGLPAPGHPPARLRAEEPEAGIQARGLRAVRAAARRGEDRSHARADDGAHPVAGAGGARPPRPSKSAPARSAT